MGKRCSRRTIIRIQYVKGETMPMLKKISKTEYKVYRQTHGNTPHKGTSTDNKTYRDWQTIRARGDSLKGTISVGTISTPENLVGKKIEIYVRIKNDNNKPRKR